MNKFDVIVCGGGTAGLCAATMAARMGATVAVLEEDNTIGGAPIDNMIHMFCGETIQGIQKEMVDSMKSMNPQMKTANAFFPGSYLLAWKKCMQNLPITIFTGTHIDKVDVYQAQILNVYSKTLCFSAKTYIDATGNGDIAHFAGCDMAYGRESRYQYDESFAPCQADNKVQQCTLMYTVRRRPDCNHEDPANWVHYDSQNYLIWGPTVTVQDTTDPQQLALAYQKAMDILIPEIHKWEEKGFTIVQIAPKIGFRESRRLQGEYVLNQKDIMAKTVFPDSIAVVKYAIDPWDPDGNPLHRGENVETPFYEIPYRALITRKISNLLVAGRCISASHVANSSCRVMPIAGVTGHVAGVAAALSKGNVFDIDIKKLQTLLIQQGVQIHFQ